MPEVNLITSLDDPRLLTALERNVGEGFAALAANLGGDVYHGSEYIRYVTGIPDVFFNGIHATLLVEDGLDTAIAGALAPYKEQGLPVAWWVNSESSTPPSLGERLMAAGLKPAPGSQGYAANIGAIPALDVPSSVTIASVQDEAGAETFTRVFAAGMRIRPEQVGFTNFIVKDSLVQNDARQAYFLGYLNGEPVVTGGIFYHAGVAGIHSVATLDSARGQGVATEMLRHLAVSAGQAGYHVAVTQYMAPINFQMRLGFTPVLRYTMYVWTPPE